MLEIAFSQDKNHLFLGQKCPVVSLYNQFDAFNWDSFLIKADEIIKKYAKERVVIIQLEENFVNDFSLALSVKSYDENTCLETVVFEVDDANAVGINYLPYIALSNAIRYMRDLYRMDIKEAYADIARLGYLGLNIFRDFLNNQIVLKWKTQPYEKIFYAHNNTSVLVLVAMMKYWAIAKSEQSILAILGGESEAQAYEIPDFSSEEEMINYVINMVRV